MMMNMMMMMMIMMTTMMVTKIPVDDLGGVVRSHIQPLQKFHLGAGHGPPQRKLSKVILPRIAQNMISQKQQGTAHLRENYQKLSAQPGAQGRVADWDRSRQGQIRPKLTQFDPNWPKLTQVDSSWLKLTQVHVSSRKFAQVDRQWPKLTQIDPSWPKFAKVHPSSPKLTQEYPSWPTMTQFDTSWHKLT